MRDPRVRLEVGQPLGELRSDDGHRCSRFEQQIDATLRHDPPADDEYGAMLEIREQG
jgi:hypothetical protein